MPIRYLIERFSSWEEFRKVISDNTYRSWAFRGQSDSSWPLYTSLSRHLLTRRVHRSAWSRQERRVLRIFKRKAHLLLQHLPKDTDAFEWLALMQRHGAPTRLLDFTWSPFVASFFALEHATTDAAVWALFPPALNNRPYRTKRSSRRVTGDEIGP